MLFNLQFHVFLKFTEEVGELQKQLLSQHQMFYDDIADQNDEAEADTLQEELHLSSDTSAASDEESSGKTSKQQWLEAMRRLVSSQDGSLTEYQENLLSDLSRLFDSALDSDESQFTEILKDISKV